MSNNKQIVKNSLILYVRMGIVLTISLFTSRIVLNTLGETDFGVYSVVASVIVLFSFLSNSLNTALLRYLSFALGKKDDNLYIKYFSQGFFAFFLIGLMIVFLGETVGLYVLEHYINLPLTTRNAAFWVYEFSILSFVLQLMRTPYNSALISHEKFSFYAFTSILEVLLKLVIVYLLVYIKIPKLISYSALLALIGLVLLIIYILYCSSVIKGCRICLKLDWGIIKEFMFFSGWTTLTSASNVVTNQGINILLNNFFGVIVSAATGIANQILSAASQFLGNFQIAFNPQIVKSYASGDRNTLIKLIYRSSIFSFFLMTLISAPLIIKMGYILKLWLINVPPFTESFGICVLLSLLVESLSGPLWMTVQATGKIKNYQIIISLTYFSYFVLSYLLLKIGLSPVIIFGMKIIISLVVVILRVVLLNRIYEIGMKKFLLDVILRSIIIFSAILIPLYLISQFAENFIGLLFFILFSCIFISIVFFIFGFDKDDQIELLNFLKSKVIK